MSKLEPRTKQFKIRVSDSFLKLLKIMQEERKESASNLIHHAFAHYSLMYSRDMEKVRNLTEIVRENRNKGRKRKNNLIR